MKKCVCVAFLAAAVVLTGTVLAEDKPKNDIPSVMEMAHKGGQNSLKTRVATNKGEKADAEKLLALYEDLSKNKPPKGEAASWKTKTTAMVAAAKKLVDDPKDKAAGQALNRVVNCKACHDAHREE
jgi:hypothetical protein